MIITFVLFILINILNKLYILKLQIVFFTLVSFGKSNFILKRQSCFTVRAIFKQVLLRLGVTEGSLLIIYG